MLSIDNPYFDQVILVSKFLFLMLDIAATLMYSWFRDIDKALCEAVEV